MFLSFCEAEELLSKARTNAMQHEIEGHIKAVIKAQSDYQTIEDEPTRFIDTLRSVLSSGNGHISDNFKNNAPLQKPFLYGWRNDGTVNLNGDKIYKSCADCIGWINQVSDEIYLDMEATYKAVQCYSKDQSNPFLTTKSDILRQLGERGIAKASENNAKSGTKRYDVKRFAGEASRRVLVISGTLIRGE